jgi:glucokinase
VRRYRAYRFNGSRRQVIITGLWTRLLRHNNMQTLLAADIGGTKTLLQLSHLDGEIILQQRLENDDYADFESLLTAFFSTVTVDFLPVSSACFAVAAPLSGRRVELTNRSWIIDSDRLLQKFPLVELSLVNDFEAVGYGIGELEEKDLIVLQQGKPEAKSLRAVIGAGTGLGQAILSPLHKSWRVWPTEGGHTDFAAQDIQQQALLNKLFEQFEHVSYERILSGSGLVTLYQFVVEQQGINTTLNLTAEQISQSALQKTDPAAITAMHLFIQIYGAQAGNLALTTLPKGGIFIAGGIAVKNLDLFEQGFFMQSFLAKGRMRGVLEQIPVYLINNPDVGLLGARLLAGKALYNVAHD